MADEKATLAELLSKLANIQLYAVFMTPTAKWDMSREESREKLREHLLFLADLERRGVLFAAGPFMDETAPGRATAR